MQTINVVIRPIKGMPNKCLLTLVDSDRKVVDYWKMNTEMANRMSRDQAFFDSSHYKTRIEAAANRREMR